MTKDNRIQIQQLSRRLNAIIKLMLVLVPTATMCYWLGFNLIPAGLLNTVTYGVTELNLAHRLLLCLISLLPLSVAMWCLWTLHKLFTLFAQNIFYHHDNVRLFRSLGIGLIGWVIADFIFTPLQSIIMTLQNPEGMRILALSFELNDAVMLLAGFVTILLAWIVEEGRKIEEENIHTI